MHCFNRTLELLKARLKMDRKYQISMLGNDIKCI